jgi:hypothetical protein
LKNEKDHILSDPLFLEKAKDKYDGRCETAEICHFGGRSWNTLGDCGWGIGSEVD